MAGLLAPPGHQYTDNNGNPLALGKVYTYEAGTLNNKTTYTTSTEATPLANPVVLDAYGRTDIWLATDGLYKIVIKDANNNTISTTDDVSATGGSFLAGITAAGNLDMNGYDIVSNNNYNIDIIPAGTGKTNVYDLVSKDNLDLDGNNIIVTDSTGIVESSSLNEILIFNSPASAVNYTQVDSAAAGNNPKISALGDDTNIGLDIQPKGTGAVVINGTSTSSAEIRLAEDTDNGTNYIGLKAPASIASNTTFTLPSADGSANQVLRTNGSGTLSFATQGLTYLGSVSPSAAATADITSMITSAYRVYYIYLIGLTAATDNVMLHMKVSNDNGSTWVAGTAYSNAYSSFYNSTASTGAVNAGSAFQMFAGNITNTLPLVQSVTLMDPATSGKKTYFVSEGYNTEQALTYQRTVMSSGIWNSTTAVTAVQFYFSSGNIASGDILVYGVV